MGGSGWVLNFITQTQPTWIGLDLCDRLDKFFIILLLN